MRARRRRQARVLPLAQAVLTGAHLLRLWSRRGGCALLIAMMALLADLGGLIVFGFLRKRPPPRMVTCSRRPPPATTWIAMMRAIDDAGQASRVPHGIPGLLPVVRFEQL